MVISYIMWSSCGDPWIFSFVINLSSFYSFFSEQVFVSSTVVVGNKFLQNFEDYCLTHDNFSRWNILLIISCAVQKVPSKSNRISYSSLKRDLIYRIQPRIQRNGTWNRLNTYKCKVKNYTNFYCSFLTWNICVLSNALWESFLLFCT